MPSPRKMSSSVSSWARPAASTFYVAGAATLCVEQACVRTPAPVRALLERATAGVPAFHPSIRSVSIGGARAADASAFGALFDRLTPVPTAPATVWTSRAIPITVRLTPQSPWSATGTVSMTYFPQFHLLARGGAWIRVDAAVDIAEAVATRDALARALAALPPDQQLAVHLRLVEGYSFSEVGRLMGRSRGACQMLVLRAGRRLRKTLEQEGAHAAS